MYKGVRVGWGDDSVSFCYYQVLLQVVNPTPSPIVTYVAADLVGCRLNVVIHMICVIYVDHFHHNDGTHINGGVLDDAV